MPYYSNIMTVAIIVCQISPLLFLKCVNLLQSHRSMSNHGNSLQNSHHSESAPTFGRISRTNSAMSSSSTLSGLSYRSRQSEEEVGSIILGYWSIDPSWHNPMLENFHESHPVLHHGDGQDILTNFIEQCFQISGSSCLRRTSTYSATL